MPGESGGEGRGDGAPWWGLLVGLAGFIALFPLAKALAAPWSFLVIAAVIGALGVAGWRWGADSRDGHDWKPLELPR